MDQPKEPPPRNEDRETVDPRPRAFDPEKREHRPDKPEDGPEAEPPADTPEAEVASHSE
ncbi:MAG: hypothetical protein ACRDKX_09665 [Solirubrobacterales bacterium]